MSPWIMVMICFVSAVMLLTVYRKENPVYTPAGICLLLMGVYKAIDAVTDEALSYSWVIWVKRAFQLAMLIVIGYMAWQVIRKARAEKNEE
ncbi:MAG: hypothetical protein IJY28_06755 [Clostridia bacterium]|nr:hypothetical protein [Clostridia bacterium]